MSLLEDYQKAGQSTSNNSLLNDYVTASKKETVPAWREGLYPWQHGFQNVSSRFYNRAGNLIELLATQGGGYPHGTLADAGRWAAKGLRGIGERVAPTGEVKGFIPKLASGTADILGEIPLLIATGPGAPALAALEGGLDADQTNPLAMATGAAQGALTLKSLQGLSALKSLLARTAVGGGTFGGLAAAQGSPTEDVAAQTVLGAIMSLPGGGKTANEQILAQTKGYRPSPEMVAREYAAATREMPKTTIDPSVFENRPPLQLPAPTNEGVMISPQRGRLIKKIGYETSKTGKTGKFIYPTEKNTLLNDYLKASEGEELGRPVPIEGTGGETPTASGVVQAQGQVKPRVLTPDEPVVPKTGTSVPEISTPVLPDKTSVPEHKTPIPLASGGSVMPKTPKASVPSVGKIAGYDAEGNVYRLDGKGKQTKWTLLGNYGRNPDSPILTKLDKAGYKLIEGSRAQKQFGVFPAKDAGTTLGFAGTNPEVAKTLVGNLIRTGAPKEGTPIERPLRGPEIDFKESPDGKIEVVGDVSKLKDINGITKSMRDAPRNIEKVFGEKADNVLVNHFHDALNKNVTSQNLLLEDYTIGVEKNFGITPHSEADIAVMAFGEGRLSKEQVIKKFGEKQAQNIFDAEKWYRDRYDRTRNTANEVISQVYPNRPDKLIPYRKDYFRHFQETGGIHDILRALHDVSDLSTSSLVGGGVKIKPRSKTLSFMKQRLGTKAGESAAAAYANYIQQVSYATHINPIIARIREFTNGLRRATGQVVPTAEQTLSMKQDVAKSMGNELVKIGDRWQFQRGTAQEAQGKLKLAQKAWNQRLENRGTQNLNNLIGSLDTWANRLSGMPEKLDAAIQEYGGGGALRVADAVANRMASNAILGNLSALIGTQGNLPVGVAKLGPKYFNLGVQDALTSIFTKNEAMSRSHLMVERYGSDAFNKFQLSWLGSKTGFWKRPYIKQFATWMIETSDKVATKALWNGFYRKGIDLRETNPIHYADIETGKIVGLRGIGQIPPILESKALRLVSRFQLEILNSVWALGETIKEKPVSGLMTFCIASWLFNKAAKEIRGTQVSVDPIQAMIDAYNIANSPYISTANKLYRVPGRLVGEGFSNMPFGQTVAGVLPEKFRKEFFGSQDPSRFGVSSFIAGGFKNPETMAKSLALPFGGTQVGKTIGGIRALNRGYVESNKGNYLFPTGQSPIDVWQNLAFGKWSTPEAREYFNRNDKTYIRSGSNGGRPQTPPRSNIGSGRGSAPKTPPRIKP